MRIETELATYDGVKYNDESRMVCGECGGLQREHIRHIDAVDSFTNVFQCICGNEISITIMRKDMDAIMEMGFQSEAERNITPEDYIDHSFRYLCLATEIRSGKGEETTTDAFLVEGDDELYVFLQKFDYIPAMLESAITGELKDHGKLPFAVILFDGEYQLAGHMKSIRTSKELASFSYYSWYQRKKKGLLELKNPLLSMVFVATKEELETLAGKSPLFVPAWLHMKDKEESPYEGWVYVSQGPDPVWLKEHEKNDEALLS